LAILKQWLAAARAVEPSSFFLPNDLSQPNKVLIRRQQALQQRQLQRPVQPRQHGDHDDGWEALLGGLDVPVHVRVGGKKAKRLSVRDVGDDVEGKVLRFAAKIKRAVVLLGGEVFCFDEVDEGGNVFVYCLLQVLDFLPRILGAPREPAVSYGGKTSILEVHSHPRPSWREARCGGRHPAWTAHYPWQDRTAWHNTNRSVDTWCGHPECAAAGPDHSSPVCRVQCAREGLPLLGHHPIAHIIIIMWEGDPIRH